MAACSAPPQMPFPSGPTATSRRTSKADGLHPLVVLRLRMERGEHRHSGPAESPPSPRKISSGRSNNGGGGGGGADGSQQRQRVPPPPLPFAAPPPLPLFTPQPAPYGPSLSPPPTPGRPRRHASRRDVDVSAFPPFLPAGHLGGRHHHHQRPRVQGAAGPEEPADKRGAEKRDAAPRTPYRPEPRFECSWIKQVDAELGNGSDEEDDRRSRRRLPEIPFAPFDFSPPKTQIAPSAPATMHEMTLKPMAAAAAAAAAASPSAPPFGGGEGGGPGTGPASAVARKLSGVSLSSGSQVAAVAASASSSSSSSRRRRGNRRSSVNARCA